MKVTKAYLEALIREAVIEQAHLVDEDAPKTAKGPFKLGQFRTIKDHRARLQYLRTRDDVQEIAAGSSRIVFFINNKKQVMKVGMWERGKAQNRTEFEAQSCGNPVYLPKMFAKAADFSWIIVESVNPMKSAAEFEEATGFPIKALELGVNFRSLEMQRRPDSDKTKQKWAKIYKAMSQVKWFRGLVNMAVNCDLVAGDLGKWDSWGITKRGRVVLVDYGLTEAVWDTYYARTS